jgi:hypothetical protein
MLSNNKFYPLLKIGQRVPTEEKTSFFGIIDKSNTAKFVISDGDEKNQTFSEIFSIINTVFASPPKADAPKEHISLRAL